MPRFNCATLLVNLYGTQYSGMGLLVMKLWLCDPGSNHLPTAQWLFPDSLASMLSWQASIDHFQRPMSAIMSLRFGAAEMGHTARNDGRDVGVRLRQAAPHVCPIRNVARKCNLNLNTHHP